MCIYAHKIVYKYTDTSVKYVCLQVISLCIYAQLLLNEYVHKGTVYTPVKWLDGSILLMTIYNLVYICFNMYIYHYNSKYLWAHVLMLIYLSTLVCIVIYIYTKSIEKFLSKFCSLVIWADLSRLTKNILWFPFYMKAAEK